MALGSLVLARKILVTGVSCFEYRGTRIQFAGPNGISWFISDLSTVQLIPLEGQL